MGGFFYLLVESAVAARVFLFVAPVLSDCHSFSYEAQLVDFCFGGPLGGLSCERGFERLTRLKDIGCFFDGKTSCADSAVDLAGDIALLRQPGQDRAQRAARNVELRGEVRFGQSGIRFDVARQQQRAQPVVGLDVPCARPYVGRIVFVVG